MRYPFIFLLLLLAGGLSCTSPKSDKQPPADAQTHASEPSGVRDYLSGTWILQSINGISIGPDQFDRLRPFIDLSFSEHKMTGFTGCTRMSAPVSLQKTILIFGPVETTEPSCPSLNLEQQFLTQLSEQSLFFDLRGSKLILTNEVSRLTFRRPSRY